MKQFEARDKIVTPIPDKGYRARQGYYPGKNLTVYPGAGKGGVILRIFFAQRWGNNFVRSFKTAAREFKKVLGLKIFNLVASCNQVANGAGCRLAAGRHQLREEVPYTVKGTCAGRLAKQDSGNHNLSDNVVTLKDYGFWDASQNPGHHQLQDEIEQKCNLHKSQVSRIIDELQKRINAQMQPPQLRLAVKKRINAENDRLVVRPGELDMVRAERRAGARLEAIPKAKGGNPNLPNALVGCNLYKQALAKANISDDLARLWQIEAGARLEAIAPGRGGDHKSKTNDSFLKNQYQLKPNALVLNQYKQVGISRPGELDMVKQGEWINENIPEDGAKGIGPVIATKNSRVTLADVGIDRNEGYGRTPSNFRSLHRTHGFGVIPMTRRET